MAADELPWTHRVTGLRRLRRRQRWFFGHAPPDAYPPGHQVSRAARILDRVLLLALTTASVTALYQLPVLRDPDRGFVRTLPYGLAIAAISVGHSLWAQRKRLDEAP